MNARNNEFAQSAKDSKDSMSKMILTSLNENDYHDHQSKNFDKNSQDRSMRSMLIMPSIQIGSDELKSGSENRQDLSSLTSIPAYKKPGENTSARQVVESKEPSREPSSGFESVSISEESAKAHEQSEASKEKMDEELEENLKYAAGSARSRRSASPSARGQQSNEYDHLHKKEKDVGEGSDSVNPVPTTFDRKNESIINPTTLAVLSVSRLEDESARGKPQTSAERVQYEIKNQARKRFTRFQKQSEEREQLEKFGFKKLANIQDGMSYKVQKQLEKLSTIEKSCVKALKKDRDQRTYQENEDLVKYFSQVNVFEKHGIDGNDLLKVIQCMYYLFIPKNTVLFRYKDEGDVFYVIINGKIQLWLPNPEIEAGKYQKKDLEAELDDAHEELREYDGVDVKAQHNQDNVNRLNAKIKSLEYQIADLVQKIEEYDEMVPVVVMENRMGFGEKALMNDAGRAGTCVSKEDTHLAVVTKDSYKKFLMKSEQAEQQQMIAFLRQIPFLLKWKQRELIQLRPFLNIVKIENRGQYVFREGEKCSKFIIIKSGEFEIVKTNLRNVYYNTVSGIVGIKEDNREEKIIRSTNPIPQNTTLIESGLGQVSSHQYVGTEFQTSIQAFLNTQVNTTHNFKDAHRSKFNQTHIKEIKVAVIGQAHTFGDVDCFRGRTHMYSLRTTTRSCEVYEMSSSEFLKQVRSKGRHHELAAFVKKHDQELVNKLAKNLQIVFEGMNIDGVKSEVHKQQKKLELVDCPNDESPKNQTQVCSPTVEMLGDQSQLHLKRKISLATIESQRKRSSLERGFQKDREISVKYGELKNLHTMKLDTKESPTAQTPESSVVPTKKIEEVMQEYTDRPLPTKESLPAQKPMTREDLVRIERILSANPGNYRRRRPITAQISECESIFSERDPSELDDLQVNINHKGIVRNDPPNQITNSDRLRYMSAFQNNSVPSKGAKSQLKTLYCREFDKKAVNADQSRNLETNEFSTASKLQSEMQSIEMTYKRQKPRMESQRRSLSPQAKLRALCREERVAQKDSGELSPTAHFHDRRSTNQPTPAQSDFIQQGRSKNRRIITSQQVLSRPKTSSSLPGKNDCISQSNLKGDYSPDYDLLHPNATTSQGVFDGLDRPKTTKDLIEMKNAQRMYSHTVLKGQHPISNRPYQSLRQAQANAMTTSEKQLKTGKDQMSMPQEIYDDKFDNKGGQTMPAGGAHMRKKSLNSVYASANQQILGNHLIRPQSMLSSQRLKARHAPFRPGMSGNAHISNARDINSTKNVRFSTLQKGFDNSQPVTDFLLQENAFQSSANSQVNMSLMESTNHAFHSTNPAIQRLRESSAKLSNERHQHKRVVNLYQQTRQVHKFSEYRAAQKKSAGGASMAGATTQTSKRGWSAQKRQPREFSLGVRPKSSMRVASTFGNQSIRKRK